MNGGDDCVVASEGWNCVLEEWRGHAIAPLGDVRGSSFMLKLN